MEKYSLSSKELEEMVEQVVREVLNLLVEVTDGGVADFSNYHLLRESHIMGAKENGCKTIKVGEKTLITPLAMDYIKNDNLTICRKQGTGWSWEE